MENNQPQPRYRFHIHDDITDPGTRTIAGTTTAASRANIPVSLPDWIDQEERVCQMILAELEAADAEAAVQEQK